jgi:uncharacterized protein
LSKTIALATTAIPCPAVFSSACEGAFPNARTVGRLEAGAWDGLLHEVKTALKQGEDVSQLGKVYGSALHAAAVNGHLEIVKLLIACGADANARDRDGMTAVETRRK